MPGTATWPVTVNGNTYTLADFDGFAYVQNFPAIISDINVVALQAAADRAAIQAALANNGNLLIPQTQCRLEYISTTQIRLQQFGGNFIWINGLNRPIPFGGVNLANDGLAEATLYYVYAYMNGATMMMEGSTVNYVASANGIRVKNGDATRTLVGMIYMDTGGVFANSSAKRYVRSYLNRPQFLANGSFGSGSTSSTSTVDIAPFSFNLVAFADDAVDIYYVGNIVNNGGNSVITLGVDGGSLGSAQAITGGSGTGNVPISPRVIVQRPDGMRVISIRASVSAGTATLGGQLFGSIG
ncbi:hypothetical protein [Methylorubrum sp. SB2]|uniref:hypothetical protein n=1 Tax=Methylorubrum subtropicum TaxID=3138812 RepID=UPI00313D89C9